MANTTKIVYVTQEQYNTLVSTGTITVGGVTYTYDANNTYMVKEDGIEGVDIKSTNATNGKVLTADGSGGASWQTAGGGGSGDVTASGTLTSNAIILGNGTKSVKAMSAGQNGDFLCYNGSSAVWKNLYMHTIHLHVDPQMESGTVDLTFTIINTTDTPFEYLSEITSSRYLATGYCSDPNIPGTFMAIAIDITQQTADYVNTSTGTIESMMIEGMADEIGVTDDVTMIW